MDTKHIIKIIFIIIIICVIVVTFIAVIKKNDKKTYMFDGMLLGFVIGTIAGSYFLTPIIGAPIGMFLGIGIGKRKKREE